MKYVNIRYQELQIKFLKFFLIQGHTLATVDTQDTGRRQTKQTTQKTITMSNTDPTKYTTQKTITISNTDPTKYTTQKTKTMSNTDPTKYTTQ
jgi:hypothetical protein